MSVYILRWNPAISSYKTENHKELKSHLDKGEHPLDFNWSIREWENLKEDDFFVLQQVGTDNDGIAMFGKFKGPCYEGKSWRKDGTKIHYADMWIMDVLDCDENNILSAKKYEKLFPEIKWHGGHSGVLVNPEIADILVSEIEKDMIKAGIWKEDYLENFRNYHGPETYDDQSGENSTEELLADGKTLVALKKIFLEDQTEDNLFNLVCCLHDSTVKVPVHVEMSDEVKAKVEESIRKGEEEVRFDGGVEYFPVTLQNDEGESAMGIFSNEEEIGDHYAEDKDIILMDIPVPDCIEFFKETEELKVMVLDAFSMPLVISKELADLILKVDYYSDEVPDSETEE